MIVHLRQLRQWLAVVDGKNMGIFTPAKCDEETARAIAIATFGPVERVVDEGTFSQVVPEEENG